MTVKKINIVSSSYIINEGLKTAIQQLTGNHIVEDFFCWDDFLESFDSKIAGQTIFVDVKSLPEKERLKSIRRIINDNIVVILLYLNDNEIERFEDFASIPLNISKGDLSKRLGDIILNGETNMPENNVLSERELTILKKVALGFTNKEISDKLYISMHTVITHRKNITAKLGIKTISGLTVYALINNIISPADLNN